ncbi:unnamed protein product [Adineta ricciae]|uniref:Uncharacterized protein n=1 Tax=Adineta ricciae TaxID=249248 RepID=A0A815ZFH6_ADIRI|nr:unnamed protein product [Adineta ricciae]CAF1584417.1 unnamed protein product [Adineta ricciae]
MANSLYFLTMVIVLLQISFNVSLPIESNDGNSPWIQHKLQTWDWSRYRDPPEPKWTFRESSIDNYGFRFNPEYQATSRLSIAPHIDYGWRQGVTGGGIRLRYKFRRSADEQNKLAQQDPDLIYNRNNDDAQDVN